MSDYASALKKHDGDVVKVAANEPFEAWSLGDSMRMISDLVRAVALAELARRGAEIKEPKE